MRDGAHLVSVSARGTWLTVGHVAALTGTTLGCGNHGDLTDFGGGPRHCTALGAFVELSK